MLKCPLCDFKSKNFPTLKKHFLRTHLDGICPVCGLKTRNLCIHAYHASKYCELHKALYYLVSKGSADDISVFEKGIEFGKYRCFEDRHVFVSVYDGRVLVRTSNTLYITTLEEIAKISECEIVKDILMEMDVVDWYVGKGLLKLLKSLKALNKL